MNVVGRIEAAASRRIDAARDRLPGFDHLWRAGALYADVLAGRLAAAIAYYGFFAVFALALVAYWVFGAILEDNDEVSRAAADFLERNLPFLDPQQIAQSSNTVGVVGLIILVFTGIGWVEAIRSSQRLMYGLNQQPGNLVIRRLVDLGVLVAIFVLLGVSAVAVDALGSLLRFLLRSTGSVGLTAVSALLSVLVNAVLAVALLVAVPRLRMSRRRLRPVVLVVAVGITLLNTVGRYYVVRTERNPAYTVVATAVGLLLYLYLLNQLLLFGAALAATSRYGRVVDLAEGGAAREVDAETAAQVGVITTRVRPGSGHDEPVGALVTLDLPDDSPMLGLPWIITFGPLGGTDEWEPVVCGPYERPHALALAEAVVAEEQLMAVVEPLLPALTPEEIRGEIAAAQIAAEDEAARTDQADLYGDFEDVIDEELELAAEREPVPEPATPPSRDEVRAGFARIAKLLASKDA